MDEYTKEYADFVDHYSQDAAKAIIPLIIKPYGIKSVVDFGCGKKAFLKATGLYDVVGVDQEYVDPDIIADLNTPIDLKRKFDLVISLEVAEHLKPESADTFVDTLCSHGDLILFSASIPTGINPLHLNEQYWEYWISKFKSRGFYCEDFLRNAIWDNPKVAACYKNGLLMFIKEGSSMASRKQYRQFHNYIHPEFYGCIINKHYKGKTF